MEAFALLKYWRSGGGASGGATIITTADTRAAVETDAADDEVSPYSSDGEDGPYIDLEFPHRDGESDEGPPPKSPGNPHETASEDEETESGEDEDDDDEEGEELKFALASGDCTDHGTAALSPSDEVFFGGDLVSIENSKLPVFLAKSATRFRVLLLKLKKSKSGDGKNEDDDDGKNEKSPGGNFTAVKTVNLFTRDSSSKESGHGGKGQKGNFSDDGSVSESTAAAAAAEERKLTKEMVQKYLKMVKPFYVRVSKRYVEKLRFPGNSAPPKGAAAAAARADSKKGHNLESGMKVVRKRLGKSRSASAAASAASNRRETSLPDGIEGAILHCKRSFNAAGRDAGESSSILCRSASDPSGDKSAVVPKTASFCGEAKRLGLDRDM